MITLLQKKGFNVTAVQPPLTSLSDDIAATRNVLSMQEGPTVLVGHSCGGAVITGAANEAPNVTSLVYIAAFGRGIYALRCAHRKGFLLDVSSFSSLGLPIAVLRIVVDKIPTSR